MKAMLLIYNDEKAWAALPKAQLETEIAAYGAYAEALVTAGKFVTGSELQPSGTAKSVVVGAEGPRVADGPYVETKEQLGGYFLIEVADMDEAVAWAAKCPGARHGTVEVRPLMGGA